MTLRVLHAVQELGHGGAESIVALLCDGAAGAGLQVAVAAAPGPFERAFAVPRFDLPIVDRAPVPLMRAALALRRAVQAWRPDIVHCHNPTMAIAAVLATGRRARPRKLVPIHGVADAEYRIAARILRLLAQRTVACGPGVAARLRAHALETTIIANGCGPAPAPLQRAALEREFPALRGRALVVGVGRLARVKNFRASIDACCLLPDAMLVIAGEGTERASLLAAAREAGVADRVALCGHRADARALIGAADVTLISSAAEGLPLVAIESMLAGTPIVAARGAWQQGVLQDGHDCLIVPANDAAATAGAVGRLLHDRALALRLAANARVASAAYAAQATIDGYLALYRRMVVPAP